MCETKKCKGCGEVLPLSEFDIETKNKDGRRGKCKECIRKYNAWYQATKRNRKRLEATVGSDVLVKCRAAGFPYVLGKMTW